MNQSKLPTMQDILDRVPPFTQRDPTKWCPSPDLSDFEMELETGTNMHNGSDEFDERVTMFEVNAWMCTDTLVGVYAYYFDGEFVALSFQSARKNDKEFAWVSKEKADQVRKFIHELHAKHVQYHVVLINPKEEVQPFWLVGPSVGNL